MEIFYKRKKGRNAIAILIYEWRPNSPNNLIEQDSDNLDANSDNLDRFIIMKYYIVTFGCQMNASDSERIASVLEKIGHKPVYKINEANLVVVNACSVRQSAIDRIHGLSQKFNKAKQITILTGCVLKKDKKIFSKNFNHIIDIRDIKKLPEIISKKLVKNKDNYLEIIPKYSSKLSANVPVMTGCNNFCAYCVVPYTREREISRPARQIIAEIKNLVKNGCKEIWLLGQNVNSYKDKNIDFPKLLKMANKIQGNFWIRFTSSHPKDFNDKVINALATGEKITPYLNLPVQSGDDKILKAMARHYTIKDYKNKIKKLREKIPDICLSTDVIVGFPGETKKQFENTAKLFREIKFDMAYINKYSARAGTAAAKLKDDVPIAEKKRREKILTKILKKTATEKNKKFVGKKIPVLVMEHGAQHNIKYYLIGKTYGYKTVKIHRTGNIKHGANLAGKFVMAKITKAHEWALEGELV